jgi:hypothetical protein
MVVRHLRNLLTALSLLLFVAACAAWLASYRIDPRDGGVRAAGEWRVGAFDGRVSVYNQFLPYTGGIRFAPAKALDLPGVYARSFEWPGLWYFTLTVSLAYPVLLGAAIPAYRLVRTAARSRPRTPGSCRRRCGYDLQATPDRCPGCGSSRRDVAARPVRAGPCDGPGDRDAAIAAGRGGSLRGFASAALPCLPAARRMVQSR